MMEMVTTSQMTDKPTRVWMSMNGSLVIEQGGEETLIVSDDPDQIVTMIAQSKRSR